jgi:hypothetical protein
MREQRIVALDGVRGLAAFAVALPHYLMVSQWHTNICEAISIVGVEVFFVLSGFVLAPQILFCMSDRTSARLPIFFMRRWMRTLPPYVLALSIMGLLTGNFLNANFLRHMVFLQNLFSINDGNEFFAPAWSLSVEEWFYVLFPFYLVLMKRLSCGISFSAMLFVLIFFISKAMSLLIGTESLTVMRRLVIFRLDSIGFGFLLFLGTSWLREQRAAATGGVAGGPSDSLHGRADRDLHPGRGRAERSTATDILLCGRRVRCLPNRSGDRVRADRTRIPADQLGCDLGRSAFLRHISLSYGANYGNHRRRWHFLRRLSRLCCPAFGALQRCLLLL